MNPNKLKSYLLYAFNILIIIASVQSLVNLSSDKSDYEYQEGRLRLAKIVTGSDIGNLITKGSTPLGVGCSYTSISDLWI